MRSRSRNGEVGALVGPSGCGKTTLLRIIAGLDRDYAGTRAAARPRQARHGVPGAAAAALAHGRAERAAGGAGGDATRRSTRCSTALGLAAHRDHFPGELSLGLARRVALARAFAVEPDLLLLDEPFVSLDDALAARLRDELAELVNRRPVTTLLVTHNIEEAIGLADRLFLLSPSPARVVAEVPIERPRAGAIRRRRLAALRDVIVRKLRPA